MWKNAWESYGYSVTGDEWQFGMCTPLVRLELPQLQTSQSSASAAADTVAAPQLSQPGCFPLDSSPELYSAPSSVGTTIIDPVALSPELQELQPLSPLEKLLQPLQPLQPVFSMQESPASVLQPADPTLPVPVPVPSSPVQQPVQQLQQEQTELKETHKRGWKRRRKSGDELHPLLVNKKLSCKQSSGCYTLWFFILRLLVDERKKDVVVWTGERREFRIVYHGGLRGLWSQHNGRKTVKRDSMERILRGLSETVLVAVISSHHKGHNVPGLYRFITEPSHHLNWSVAKLDDYITKHALPLLVTPADFDKAAPTPKRHRVALEDPPSPPSFPAPAAPNPYQPVVSTMYWPTVPHFPSTVAHNAESAYSGRCSNYFPPFYSHVSTSTLPYTPNYLHNPMLQQFLFPTTL